MRALVIFLFVLGAVAFMASCGSDVTEVAWKNATDVSGTNYPINEIIWEQDSIKWSNGTSGYAFNITTESKEVTSVNSTVECKVDTGSGFGIASQVYINGSTGAVPLKEGESQVLSLNAQP